MFPITAPHHPPVHPREQCYLGFCCLGDAAGGGGVRSDFPLWVLHPDAGFSKAILHISLSTGTHPGAAGRASVLHTSHVAKRRKGWYQVGASWEEGRQGSLKPLQGSRVPGRRKPITPSEQFPLCKEVMTYFIALRFPLASWGWPSPVGKGRTH